jgi:DNA-directed RNA polymerase specialized sigma24 family protein
MSTTRTPVSDDVLVQRCLAGDPCAWQALFDGYHRPLLYYVLRLLGGVAGRADLADEIMGRLWYALVEEGCDRLSHFNPARGRLGAFLTMIVRQQVQQWFRGHAGPRRLVPLPRVQRSAPDAEPLSLSTLLEEFEQRLSPFQRRFLRDELLAPAGGEPADELSDGAKKLRQRIADKFRAYLDGT